MQAKLKALRETADRRYPPGSNPKMWLQERGGGGMQKRDGKLWLMSGGDGGFRKVN